MALIKTVISFGEILWDLLPTGAVLGGAPFNLAYRVNSLGDRGIIVSRLGRDNRGEEAWKQAAALGMETGFLQWDEKHSTGIVDISFDENHEPDYTIVPDVAYDYIEATESLLAAVPKADCLCFGTLAQRSPVSRAALHQLLLAHGDRLKLLDINLRKNCYSQETITSSLQFANILKLNEGEVQQLGPILRLPQQSLPEFCRAILQQCSLDCCVVTLAERGSFAASDGAEVYVPGCPVQVVDPVGAGDAFTAAFLHHYLRGQSLEECLQAGNQLGSLAASRRGATG